MPPTLDPVEVATRLARVARWPGASDLAERAWKLVAHTPEFDAWVIAWPTGGRVALHDHGRSSGAIVVVRGSLVETVPWWDDAGRLTMRARELRPGAALRLGAGHIHDVTNEAGEAAVSLHVYHPPLSAMTHYDVEGDRLVARGVGLAADWVDETPVDLHHRTAAERSLAS